MLLVLCLLNHYCMTTFIFQKKSQLHKYHFKLSYVPFEFLLYAIGSFFILILFLCVQDGGECPRDVAVAERRREMSGHDGRISYRYVPTTLMKLVVWSKDIDRLQVMLGAFSISVTLLTKLD